MRLDRYTLGAVLGAAALLVGGGTALASKSSGDSATNCQDRLARIAERRGVTVAELEANVKARLLARVDAALAAGRITSDRAAALRERIASGDPCSAPVRKAIRHRARHLVQLAADYLGLTRAQLREQLPGTSLGALAVGQGKTAAGLEAALLAPAKDRLTKAVAAGTITQAQADARLAKLGQLVDRLVSKTFPSK
jgi:hypothetical protein